MSLQVWLPLNGNIDNQGLKDIRFTNVNATVNNNGKTGKTMLFNGSTSRIYANNVSLSNKEMTGMCWFKLEGYTSVSYPYLFSLGNGSSGVSQQIGIWISKSNNQFGVCANGSEPSPTYKISTGIWYHACITYSGNTTKFYINGQLHSTYTNTGTPNSCSCLCIGARSNGSADASTGYANNFYGYINDVRIYDNELSAKEIELISRGLVLHYPLNREGFGNENLIVGTDNWSAWYKGGRWTASNEILTYSAGSVTWNDADSPCIPWADINGKTITVSCELRSDDFNYTSGSGFSLCLIRKATQATQNYSNRRRECTPIHLTANQITTNWVQFSCTYNNFSDSNFVNTYNGGGGDWFGIYLWNYTDKSLQIRKIKIEYGDKVTQWCPNIVDDLYSKIGLDSNIENDVSGYGNDGTRIGTFSWSSDTPRYNTSTYASGSASTYLEGSKLPSEAKTVSLWIKCSKTVNSAIFNDKTSGLQIGLLNSLLYINSLASTAGFTTTHWINDEWNHVVAINNNGTRSVYVNGQPETQSGASNYYLHNSDNFWLWKRSYNNSYTFTGSLSDLRIYVTALSADDVLELYHAPISLSNNGTLITHGEYVEV